MAEIQHIPFIIDVALNDGRTFQIAVKGRGLAFAGARAVGLGGLYVPQGADAWEFIAPSAIQAVFAKKAEEGETGLEWRDNIVWDEGITLAQVIAQVSRLEYAITRAADRTAQAIRGASR